MVVFMWIICLRYQKKGFVYKVYQFMVFIGSNLCLGGYYCDIF